MAVLNRIIYEDVAGIAAELADSLASLSGTTLLITGGAGFLCSYLLDTVAYLNDHVFQRPCRLVCVDNFRSGCPERIAHLRDRSDFGFIQHDISTPLQLEEPVHWIVHGAGIASPILYRRYPLETIDVNVSGTRHLLELARSAAARGMVYISTSEIYGDPDAHSIPTPEEYRGFVSCTGPRACYDESKRLAETLCSVYHSRYSVPIKVVRPFNVYGPGQPLSDGRIIPDLMSAALHRRPLVLLSDGAATRSFCYIGDAIRALWLVLLSDASGEVFNIGNDERELRIREVAEAVRDIAGPPALPLENRLSDDPHYCTDNPQRRCPDLTRLRARFQWAPRVGLREGLCRTLQSYRLAQERAA